jgi:CDP-paratose 2-epimerase
MSAQQRLGLVQWFRPGEYARAKAVIEDLLALNIRHLRTAFAWTDYQTPEGLAWFDWLIPTIASHCELLPCFTCTPPSTGTATTAVQPPCDASTFPHFVEKMIRDYGAHFEWLEIGNPLDDRAAWDWRLETSWENFSRLVGDAARQARQQGKKPVLAGIRPTDPQWLERLCSTGVPQQVEALGLDGFPGTWDFNWQHWPTAIDDVRQLLARHGLTPEFWISACGYSTWRHDEVVQAKKLVDTLAAPAGRIYWYAAVDLPRHSNTGGSNTVGEDERCYHFGLKTADGKPKFTHRIWRERGLEGLTDLVNNLYNRNNSSVQEKTGLSIISPRTKKKSVLITGGAGFVGSNLARRLARDGRDVTILDNLHRPGVERNLESLLKSHGQQVKVALTDTRDLPAVRKLVREAAQVYHFAAQVAVTTSLEIPREDFDVNLNGTLNLLESLREMDRPPPLLFTSTNKVYGALDDIALQRIDGRYEPVSAFFARGISEQQALDFHSPYGCSKGAADQYVLDYARSYGLPAAVFRMSCVYGPHQFGTEDQGWVAHFLIQALQGKPLTLYGDGHQVRDLLFVDDLLEAMICAQHLMPALTGHAFNMGGGVENSTSLLEILARIERLTGRRCHYHFADWRQGDQRYYVSDTRLFQRLTGWQPTTDIDSGLRLLHEWLGTNTLPPTQRLSMPPEEGVLHGKLN